MLPQSALSGAEDDGSSAGWNCQRPFKLKAAPQEAGIFQSFQRPGKRGGSDQNQHEQPEQMGEHRRGRKANAAIDRDAKPYLLGMTVTLSKSAAPAAFIIAHCTTRLVAPGGISFTSPAISVQS